MYNHLFVYLFALRERTFGCDLGEHLAKTNNQGERSYFNQCMFKGARSRYLELILFVLVSYEP